MALLIYGVIFIFFMTTLGASFVFILKKNISNNINSAILGFASGIMVASSIFSLIIPAKGYETKFISPIIPISLGVLIGGLFLILLDFLIFKRANEDFKDYQGIYKMYSAVTIHNIPEGLTVGLAFGLALFYNNDLYLSAFMLSVGIGIQNLPEGLAVSMPFYSHGFSKPKSFFLGMLSGAVEPVFAVIAVFLAKWLIDFMPFLLSFAAGSMLYVVADELIPEANKTGKSNIGTIAFVLGFILMMTLDMLF